MKKEINPSALRFELSVFTETEKYHKHKIAANLSILLTDGTKHLAEKAECYWLFDLIASYQIKSSVREQQFQVWELKKGKDNGWVIKCTDGNGNKLVTQSINFSDFPLDSIKIWLVNNIAMLPTEY